MNTEKEIMSLDTEIKALKARYPIAASNVKFYVSTSQEFDVISQPVARFQFTPTYGTGQVSFTRLHAVVNWNGMDVYFPQVTEPQDGTGNVVIQVQFGYYSPSTTYKVRIIASGSSTGTFTML